MPLSPEHREAIIKANKRRSGENHPNWKGDKVGRVSLHGWVNRHKPRTGICQECGKKPKPDRFGRTTQYANISGEYRRDLDDYIELCRLCHEKLDHAE